MSSRWTASLDQGHLRFAPPAWQRPGFWNDYFHGVADAVALVKSETTFMSAEPWLPSMNSSNYGPWRSCPSKDLRIWDFGLGRQEVEVESREQ
jgi:hypothetical protein